MGSPLVEEALLVLTGVQKKNFVMMLCCKPNDASGFNFMKLNLIFSVFVLFEHQNWVPVCNCMYGSYISNLVVVKKKISSLIIIITFLGELEKANNTTKNTTNYCGTTLPTLNNNFRKRI